MRKLKYFLKNLKCFFAHKKLKKPLSKVAQNNSNPPFFLYCLNCQNGPSRRIHAPKCGLQTVYRTVIKINTPCTIKILQNPNFARTKSCTILALSKFCTIQILHDPNFALSKFCMIQILQIPNVAGSKLCTIQILPHPKPLFFYNLSIKGPL